MLPKNLALVLILSTCVAHVVLAVDCAVPSQEMSVDLWPTKSLTSSKFTVQHVWQEKVNEILA
jgi:hypothetical protein